MRNFENSARIGPARFIELRVMAIGETSATEVPELQLAPLQGAPMVMSAKITDSIRKPPV
jgi:hypothetical protein